jgi:hypothetical protein
MMSQLMMIGQNVGDRTSLLTLLGLVTAYGIATSRTNKPKAMKPMPSQETVRAATRYAPVSSSRRRPGGNALQQSRA